MNNLMSIPQPAKFSMDRMYQIIQTIEHEETSSLKRSIKYGELSMMLLFYVLVGVPQIAFKKTLTSLIESKHN